MLRLYAWALLLQSVNRVLKWMKLALIERRNRISKRTSATGTPTFLHRFAPKPEGNPKTEQQKQTKTN